MEYFVYDVFHFSSLSRFVSLLIIPLSKTFFSPETFWLEIWYRVSRTVLIRDAEFKGSIATNQAIFQAVFLLKEIENVTNKSHVSRLLPFLLRFPPLFIFFLFFFFHASLQSLVNYTYSIQSPHNVTRAHIEKAHIHINRCSSIHMSINYCTWKYIPALRTLYFIYISYLEIIC